MLTRNILARWRQWKRFESRRKVLFTDNKTEERKPYVCSASSINHLCVNSILVSVFVVTEQSVCARKCWQESLARSSQKRTNKNWNSTRYLPVIWARSLVLVVWRRFIEHHGLFLVFTAFILKPNAYNSRAQASHLDELFFHHCVGPRVRRIASP